MLQCDSKARILSAISRTLQLLESVQIEHCGEYSINRLRALQEYIDNKFSIKGLAILLCITPCPSIAIISLLELIPLNAPSAGVYDNTGFWTRFALVNFILSTCFIVIAHLGVRMLKITFFQSLIAVSVSTAVAMVTAYIFAVEIGFPVPFIMTITSFPHVGTVWAFTGIFSLRRVFADSEATKSLKEWVAATAVLSTQLFVYPLYNYAFRLSSPLGQTALSLVPGVVKIGYRLTIGNIIRQQADEKPSSLLSQPVFSTLCLLHSVCRMQRLS